MSSLHEQPALLDIVSRTETCFFMLQSAGLQLNSVQCAFLYLTDTANLLFNIFYLFPALHCISFSVRFKGRLRVFAFTNICAMKYNFYAARDRIYRKELPTYTFCLKSLK